MKIHFYNVNYLDMWYISHIMVKGKFMYYLNS